MPSLPDAEPRLEVGAGLGPGMPRDLHGQVARRLDPAGEHAGDGRAALLARHEGLHEAGGATRDLAERIRAPGDDDDDDGRAGGEQLGQQVSLNARQPRSSASQPSPDVPCPKSPARSPTRRRRRRPARAASTAAAKPERSSPLVAQPRARTRRASGSSARSASARLGTSMPRPAAGVARQDVVGEGVAAHEGARVVRGRTDHRDASQRRAVLADQRQGRAGVEQHDRCARPSRGRAPGWPASRGRPRRRRTTEASGVQSGSSRPSCDLLQRAAAGRRGRRPPRRQLAAAHPLDELLAEAEGVRQLDVDAGRERQGAGAVHVGGDAVHRGEERHGPVVRHDRAVEAPGRRAARRSAATGRRRPARRRRRSRSS